MTDLPILDSPHILPSILLSSLSSYFFPRRTGPPRFFSTPAGFAAAAATAELAAFVTRGCRHLPLAVSGIVDLGGITLELVSGTGFFFTPTSLVLTLSLPSVLGIGLELDLKPGLSPAPRPRCRCRIIPVPQRPRTISVHSGTGSSSFQCLDRVLVVPSLCVSVWLWP